MAHPAVAALDKVVLVISNNSTGSRIFLEGGATGPVSISERQHDARWFNQTWFATKASESDTLGYAYYLRNVRSGAYLQAGSKGNDGATELVMASSKPPKSIWYVSDDGGFARVTNSGNKQVLEVIKGANGLSKLVLKANDPENKQTQTWKYERISRSAQDVQDAMKANDHLPNKGVEYQTVDSCYLTLPPQIRMQIWTDARLTKEQYKKQLFDCDDFSFAMKAAVARWGMENLQADQFAILFGITFGEIKTVTKLERHAYNWYLKHDTLDKIVFFEPQTGLESDDGWNYKGFNGIF